MGAFAVVQILAGAILIAIFFIAGLVASTSGAKILVTSLRTNVLDKIPAYDFLKAKTRSKLSPEKTEGLCSAITRFNDSWQLVFEIEPLADSKVVVLLPGSPDPWSGSLCVATDGRVTPLYLTVNSAANFIKKLFIGIQFGNKMVERKSQSRFPVLSTGL